MTRRIGIVCPYAFDHHGGVQNHVRWLAGALAAQGDDVAVLAPGSATDPPPGVELTSAGRAIPVPYNGSVARVNFGPRTARRVGRWLTQGRFDLVHIHEPITPSISLHALAASTVPVVATFHTATPRSRTMSVAGVVLERLVDKIAAGIAVSESARQVVVQHLGRDAVVVPNGFEATDWPTVDAPVGDWRGGSRPRITFLGRIDEPRKGLDVLLDAVPRLLAARPDLDIVVAGSGTRSLPPPVRGVGAVDDRAKTALLTTTDVFVAPHLARESFGIVLLEALAAGARVVASALPAFVDLLEPFGPQRAATVPVDDPPALADAVRNALRRPAPPPDLDLEYRLASFGWLALRPQVEQVYRAALAAGPHGEACSLHARHQDQYAQPSSPSSTGSQSWPSIPRT